MSAREKDPRWVRVGEQLRRRRATLGYPRRTAWVRDVEGPGISGRLIVDLETGARTNFDPESLTIAEERYRLRPGAIRRVLSGETGELEPLPEPGQPAEEAGGTAPLSAPPPDSGDPADEQWDETITGPPLLREGETLRWRRLCEDSVRYALTRTEPHTGEPEHILYTFDGEWSRDAQFVVKFFRYQLDRHARPHRTNPPNGQREG